RKHMRIIGVTSDSAGIAGDLIAKRTASITRDLTALRATGCAGRLAALRCASITSGLASRLVASGLTGLTSLPAHGRTSVGVADFDAGVADANGSPTGIDGRTYAIGASGWTAASLIRGATERLRRALDADGGGAIEKGIGLRWEPADGGQPHVQLELIACARPRGTRVLDHRILSHANARALEALHRALFRRDRLGVNDILGSELSVVIQRAIEIKSRPAFAIASAGQAFQRRYFCRRRRGVRAQSIDIGVLLERRVLPVVIVPFRRHKNLQPLMEKRSRWTCGASYGQPARRPMLTTSYSRPVHRSMRDGLTPFGFSSFQEEKHVRDMQTKASMGSRERRSLARRLRGGNRGRSSRRANNDRTSKCSTDQSVLSFATAWR